MSFRVASSSSHYCNNYVINLLCQGNLIESGLTRMDNAHRGPPVSHLFYIIIPFNGWSNFHQLIFFVCQGNTLFSRQLFFKTISRIQIQPRLKEIENQGSVISTSAGLTFFFIFVFYHFSKCPRSVSLISSRKKKIKKKRWMAQWIVRCGGGGVCVLIITACWVSTLVVVFWWKHRKNL